MAKILTGALALAVALGVASAAEAQRLCSKTNSKGKTSYKVRETCKTSEVDEGQLALLSDIPGPQTVRQTELLGTRNTNNQSGSSAQLLELEDGGATAFTFATTGASSDVVITFSGECALSSASADNWVSIEILLDGVAVPPTDQDDAFCSAPGSGNYGYRASSYTVLVENLLAGDHTIEVNVRIGFGSGTWWIGDSSLVVITHED